MKTILLTLATLILTAAFANAAPPQRPAAQPPIGQPNPAVVPQQRPVGQPKLVQPVAVRPLPPRQVVQPKPAPSVVVAQPLPQIKPIYAPVPTRVAQTKAVPERVYFIYFRESADDLWTLGSSTRSFNRAQNELDTLLDQGYEAFIY